MRRGGRTGFSIVELLVVVAVTSVGFVALLQLQVASIRGLNYPAQLTAAISLGEHFLATLHMEAIEWTGNGTQTWDGPNLRLLSTLNESANPASPDSWMIAYPNVDDQRHMVDQAGGEDEYDAGLLEEIPSDENPRFCVHYRLAWATASRTLMRAEVRVLWMRDEASWDVHPFVDCDPDMASDQYLSQVQSVTLVDQIMVNSGG